MTDMIDLAYAAGIIDGEGSILLNKKNGARARRAPVYRVPVVAVAMTAEPVIRFLHETFGGYVGFRPRRTTDMWEWRVRGQHALVVVTAVHPFLREPRKVARANFILSAAFAAEQGDRTSLTPELKGARRVEFYNQFHAL